MCNNGLSEIDRVIKIIKYLYEGNTVEVEGRHYCMADNNNLGVCCLDENGKPNGKCLGLADFGLGEIFKLSSKITDDEYFMIGANRVLSNKGR